MRENVFGWFDWIIYGIALWIICITASWGVVAFWKFYGIVGIALVAITLSTMLICILTAKAVLHND